MESEDVSKYYLPNLDTAFYLYDEALKRLEARHGRAVHNHSGAAGALVVAAMIDRHGGVAHSLLKQLAPELL